MKPRLPLQSKIFWAYLTSFLSIVLLPLIVIWILLSTALNRSVQAAHDGDRAASEHA